VSEPTSWRIEQPPEVPKDVRCLLARSQVVLVARRVCNDLATLDDLREALAALDREARS
jgi:hypothetical protein